MRTIDEAKWAAKKKAKADAATANGTNASVKDRLDTLEKALGIAPAAAK